MRILCLDIGSKRIGVAVTDPLGLTAQSVGVILRGKNEKVVEEIAILLKEYEVKKMLVGLPLNEEGEVGPAAKKIREFIKVIQKHLELMGLNLPIEEWDERYSTKIAEERLIEADMSRGKRKKIIDKMAAQVILEDYLTSLGCHSE